LRDLKGGEVLLPPDLVSSGSHEVVVVHEDVNGQVGDDRNPRDGGASVELSVAESGGSGVVEDVEEHQGLLLDDEENCVCELPVCFHN